MFSAVPICWFKQSFDFSLYWPKNSSTKKLDSIETEEIRRGRDRPKLTRDTLIRRDLNDLESLPSIALIRAQWKSLIHVADPN
ncbi:hypothetical protein Scep_018932 [Stephania cephalantha]|uniref:Uncharacterized protein n=1 Tax=Stephania cephalantha TaxID=152367 RepID=A0AAP0NLP0_9MAGN